MPRTAGTELWDYLPWIESPSRAARIFVADGHFLNGVWQDGIVRLQPPGSADFSVPGFVRPNGAVVNDNGYAAVADWLRSDRLEGALVFIRPDGTSTARQVFKLNLGCLALSHDGLRVFLTTAASEDSDAKLLCYHIKDGGLVWEKRSPKPGASITVVPEEGAIMVGTPYQDCGMPFLLKIKYDGEVIAQSPDSGYQAIDWAEKARATADDVEAVRLLRIACSVEISDSQKARAYRMLGEIQEEQALYSDALESYRVAMKLNPKIGLKRKLEAWKH